MRILAELFTRYNKSCIYKRGSMDTEITAVLHIFKAYDIRGKVGSELSSELVTRVGYAFSQWLRADGPVVVGRDMRPDSAELADALILGVRQQGRDVIDIGMVTSDMAVFAIEHLKAAGAAIITASHNPGEYNGIKLFDNTPKTIGLDQGLDSIRDSALSPQDGASKEPTGTLTKQDIIPEWVDFALGFIDVSVLTPLSIVIDAGNGMAGAVLPALLEKLPFSVTRLYFELDGTFPNHQANPQNIATLKDLQDKITQTNADLGIAFDGDGDRMAMVDENCRPVTGSEMMSLLASKYSEDTDPSFVYEVRTSQAVVKRLEEHGFHGVRSKAGRSNIGEVMREQDAVFGGETTGHFFFKDYWCNDSGLISMLLALEQICKSGQPLSELIKNDHATNEMIPETNFSVQDGDGIIAAVSEKYKTYPSDTLDGLSISGDDWWLNIRKSNTEPLIRLNAEAADNAALQEIVKTVSELAKQ
jgi:phosphomannomutase